MCPCIFLFLIVIYSWIYLDPRHELRDELHLPGAEDEAGGGQDRRVRPLRLPRLLRIDLRYPGLYKVPSHFQEEEVYISLLYLSSRLKFRIFRLNCNLYC